MHARSAALLLLALSLAGCSSWAPAPAEPTAPAADVGSDAAWQLVPALDVLNATPGSRAHLPVTVVCAEPPTGEVRARVVGSVDVAVPVNATCAATVFLPVAAPENATQDDIALAVELTVDQAVARRVADLATLRVLEPTFGWAPNVTAVLVYTARHEHTDEVFFTNDAALFGLPYARSADHRNASRVLEVRGPSAGLPDGFFDALLGMEAGESRTVTLPPERAYGNATLLVREAREEEVPRDTLVDVEREEMARATFDEHIRSTGQGAPDDYAAGDAFFVEQGGNRWRYVVVDRTDTRVAYRLAPLVGDRLTLYPMWPDASEVVAVTDTQVAVYTTPTSAPGATLTWRSAWPDATTFVGSSDDAFTVRHSPAVGLRYTDREGVTLEVAEITPTHVVVARPNAHPLAGKTLVFDIRVLSLAVGTNGRTSG